MQLPSGSENLANVTIPGIVITGATTVAPRSSASFSFASNVLHLYVEGDLVRRAVRSPRCPRLSPGHHPCRQVRSRSDSTHQSSSRTGRYKTSEAPWLRWTVSRSEQPDWTFFLSQCTGLARPNRSSGIGRSLPFAALNLARQVRHRAADVTVGASRIGDRDRLPVRPQRPHTWPQAYGHRTRRFVTRLRLEGETRFNLQARKDSAKGRTVPKG